MSVRIQHSGMANTISVCLIDTSPYLSSGMVTLMAHMSSALFYYYTIVTVHAQLFVCGYTYAHLKYFLQLVKSYASSYQEEKRKAEYD